MPDANVISMAATSISPAVEFVGGESYPIETAPAVMGEKFGPCLLYSKKDNNHAHMTPWLIGAWDGENWYTSGSGYFIYPTRWAPLPRDPE